MTWRSYAAPRSSYFEHISALAGHPWNVPVGQFSLDVAAGSLPKVAWLFAPDGLSEHPGDHGGPVIRPGMEWTVARVEEVATSPLWAGTAIFITWDDWGGEFDHVEPQRLTNWSDGGPKGYRDSQFRYGPRVPCLVLSPYAKQGINSNFYSHVSIVKFCLRLFGLQPWDVPALRTGDPSGDMWECFDFTAGPRLGPPSTVPA
jgi:phospholipase C